MVEVKIGAHLLPLHFSTWRLIPKAYFHEKPFATLDTDTS